MPSTQSARAIRSEFRNVILYNIIYIYVLHIMYEYIAIK